MSAWKFTLGTLGLLAALAGCTSSNLYRSNAGIRAPMAPPVLPPPAAAPATLPAPPVLKADPAAPKKGEPPAQESTRPQLLPPTARIPGSPGPLELDEVLRSVEAHFPLLLAVEQERAIAAGLRLAAEGGFDLNLRTRATNQEGTFHNNRLDVFAEQATPLRGLSFFGGYRFGLGDFPVYYGDRVTADGGEFRAGLLLPLLKDGSIDRRRATLRQAQITESLADPLVQRARLDYLRSATRFYWNWVAAGDQYRVAASLLRIARDRQAGFEEQFKQGQIAEFVVIDNRRLIAEREGALIATERRFQQTSFDLSLFFRDADANPLIPPADRLPPNFLAQQPERPTTAHLQEDIETAYRQRPELVRFALVKERATVELQLAQNQALPALNAAVVGTQDVGKGKTSTGIFALDRQNLEASFLLDVPLQRRDATGRMRAVQATLNQLLAQERFARDQVRAEVQDAVSNLDLTFQRLERARQEQSIARRVAELERDRFQKGQSNLLEVNLRELAAASAEAKVIDTLADYFRAQAEYRLALGLPPEN